MGVLILSPNWEGRLFPAGATAHLVLQLEYLTVQYLIGLDKCRAWRAKRTVIALAQGIVGCRHLGKIAYSNEHARMIILLHLSKVLQEVKPEANAENLGKPFRNAGLPKDRSFLTPPSVIVTSH